MKPSKSIAGRRLLAAVFCALFCALCAGAAYAGTDAVELADGVWLYDSVTGTGDSRVERWWIEAVPGSDAEMIVLQGGGHVKGGGTLSGAVSAAEGMGYDVIGGVNADFFSMATGIPLGLAIEDGEYVTSAEEEPAVAWSFGEARLLEHPEIAMSFRWPGAEQGVPVYHLNKAPWPGGELFLLTDRYGSSFSFLEGGRGWAVRMRPSSGGRLGTNSYVPLEILEILRDVSGCAIGPGEFVLACSDASALPGGLYPGAMASAMTSCTDPYLAAARWAVGAGDVIIRDGAMTDRSAWTFSDGSRAPRTALGVRYDGALILFAADGRQAGHSIGLSEKALAEEMLAIGCEWAVNMDGGGSTALAAKLPGQVRAAVLGSPSDGSERRDADYVLLARKRT